MNRHLVVFLASAVAIISGTWLTLSHRSEPQQPTALPTASTTAETASSTPVSEPAPLPVYTTTDSPGSITVAAKTAAVAQPATATLTVNGRSYAIHAAAGATLEEAMQMLRTEGQLDYATETYAGLGSFVTEINGSAGGNGHYWILYVNGKKSGTGISSTRIRSGDLIEWKLEQSY